MTRTPTSILPKLALIGALVFGASTMAACSTDSLAEFGLEKVLEAQGEGDLDIDLDFSDGGFSVTGEDGEFALAFDEDAGEFALHGTEVNAAGEVEEFGWSFGQTDTPDGWPDVVGSPATQTEETSYFSFNDGSGINMTATFEHDPDEEFAKAVASRLSAAGYDTVLTTEADWGTTIQLQRDETTITVSTDSPGSTLVNVVGLN